MASKLNRCSLGIGIVLISGFLGGCGSEPPTAISLPLTSPTTSLTSTTVQDVPYIWQILFDIGVINQSFYSYFDGEGSIVDYHNGLTRLYINDGVRPSDWKDREWVNKVEWQQAPNDCIEKSSASLRRTGVLGFPCLLEWEVGHVVGSISEPFYSWNGFIDKLIVDGFDEPFLK